MPERVSAPPPRLRPAIAESEPIERPGGVATRHNFLDDLEEGRHERELEQRE